MMKTKFSLTDWYISVFLFWTCSKSRCTIFITSKSYGSKAKLAYTDTDSFVYLSEMKNIYDDITVNISAFDTSDNPKTHPLHSKENGKHWESLWMSVILVSHTNLLDFEARCILWSFQTVVSRSQLREFQDRMYSRIWNTTIISKPSKQ